MKFTFLLVKYILIIHKAFKLTLVSIEGLFNLKQTLAWYNIGHVKVLNSTLVLTFGNHTQSEDDMNVMALISMSGGRSKE
jgi:hypothetical protein